MLNKHTKLLLLLAAVLGAASVALAAIGMHALHAKLSTFGMLSTFSKAVNYAMYGALSVLAIGALQQFVEGSKFYISGYLLALGTLLFSGSLLLLSTATSGRFIWLTPWGGSLMILGWLSIGIIALFTRSGK